MANELKKALENPVLEMIVKLASEQAENAVQHSDAHHGNYTDR